MEQQNKLTKFQKAVFAEVDHKVEAIRQEIEARKQSELLRVKEEQERKSEEYVQKKTQDIRKKAKRDVAKFSLDAKRSILVKRSEITERVFLAVEKKLMEFCSSKKYQTYLQKKISAFAKEYALSEVEILVGSADFSKAEELKKAYALNCEVLEEPAIKLGGFIVRDEAKNIYFDETLSQKLSDQKSYFIENSELFL